MTIKCTIKQIGETVTYDSGFQVRECIVTTMDKYPQNLSLKFFKDKCGLLDSYRVGKDVEISYNLRGNEYKDKSGNLRHITEIVGWRIESLETTSHEQQPDRESDLPF